MKMASNYEKLINWIDKNLAMLKCDDVEVNLGKAKYYKWWRKELKFKLNEDWVREFKQVLAEMKNESKYWERDNTFEDILKNLSSKVAEREICKYLEKIFESSWKIKMEEALKVDNLLYLKHYLESIWKYSALRKVYEKLLSYGKKNDKFDENDFLTFVAYQKGRWVIRWNWIDFHKLCKKVLDWLKNDSESNIYESFKKWFAAIVAYYVYYKWTKD